MLTWILVAAFIMFSRSSAFANSKIKIEYDVDSRGGIYFTDLKEKPIRFVQLLEFINRQKDLGKFTLISRRDVGKLKSRNPVFKETYELSVKAFHDEFVFENLNVRSVCDGGYQGHIYNQGGVDAEIAMDNDTYVLGEEIEIGLLNTSQTTKQHFLISVEKQIDGNWSEVLFDITCGCRFDCLKEDASVEPGEKKVLLWDQEGQTWTEEGVSMGCAKTSGKYRFKVMIWKAIPEECLYYNDIVYSREFLINGEHNNK